MRVLVFLCLGLLAACATPRQTCERDALRDLKVVDALIAESERTVARGYAVTREPYTRTRLDFCYGSRFGYYDRWGMSFCTRPEIEYRERPVAVDLKAERAKLAELKAKRAELAQESLRKVSVCRARFPES